MRKRLHNKRKSFIKTLCKLCKRQKDYTCVLRHLTSSFGKKPFRPSIDLQIQGNKFVIVLQVVVKMKKSVKKKIIL